MATAPVTPDQTTAMTEGTQGPQQVTASVEGTQPSVGAAPKPAPPNKPSLWKNVVAGALSGLANSSGSTSFGGGLGKGAAGELQREQQEKDNAAQDKATQLANQQHMDEHTKAMVDVAHTQALIAQATRQTLNMPADYQTKIAEGRADQTEKMRQLGAMSPAGAEDNSPDHHVALQQVTALTQAHPGMVYSAEPIRGADGKIAYQAMQVNDAPLTADVPLFNIQGKKIGVIPKGTTGVVAAKAQAFAATQDITDMGQKVKNDTLRSQADMVRANAAVVAAKAKKDGANSTEWKPKVTADEKKKAELAENMTVNANSASEILHRRPDLFGAIGGRYTTVQQMVGSNDPDITAIASEIHNYAMANSGIHGFRSAEGVQRNEQVILNSFKNGPAAVKAALLAGVRSGQTFVDNARPETYKTHSKSGGVIKGMIQ